MAREGFKTKLLFYRTVVIVYRIYKKHKEDEANKKSQSTRD
jgi:hypothetical protein